MRRHRSRPEFAANRLLTSGEIRRLSIVLVNISSVDLTMKHELLTRFNHLLLFGGAERANMPGDFGVSRIENYFARAVGNPHHQKYKREKNSWKVQLDELDE